MIKWAVILFLAFTNIVALEHIHALKVAALLLNQRVMSLEAQRISPWVQPRNNEKEST